MAYVKLPTRTSSDPNSSADVNQLTDNIVALKDGTTNIAKIILDNSSGLTGLTATGGVLYYNGDALSTANSNLSYIFDGTQPFTMIKFTDTTGTAGLYGSAGNICYKGQVLGASSLDGLTDVNISSPVLNDTLVYNGSDWQNTPQNKKLIADFSPYALVDATTLTAQVTATAFGGVQYQVALYSTGESLKAQFTSPEDTKITSGRIVFTAKCNAVTSVSGKNAKWTIKMNVATASQHLNATTFNIVSAQYTPTASPSITTITWGTTTGSVGLLSNSLMNFSIVNNTGVTTPVTSEIALINLKIEIDRA